MSSRLEGERARERDLDHLMAVKGGRFVCGTMFAQKGGEYKINELIRMNARGPNDFYSGNN